MFYNFVHLILYINSVGCVISRRKSTQYCNINIAIRGIFYPELAIIIIFNTSGLFPGVHS